MAGIDPNNLNQRLAEIHQALIDGLPKSSEAEQTVPAKRVDRARTLLEKLQQDITITGELAA